jgi:hypothetical protein
MTTSKHPWGPRAPREANLGVASTILVTGALWVWPHAAYAAPEDSVAEEAEDQVAEAGDTESAPDPASVEDDEETNAATDEETAEKTPETTPEERADSEDLAAEATGESEPAPDPEPNVQPYAMSKHALAYSNVVYVRGNPIGFVDGFSIGYRYRLYDRRGKLFDPGYISIAFTPTVAPAFARVGATLQIMPLAILRLRASSSFLQYFGSFGFLASFDSPHGDSSHQALDDIAEADQNYAGRGHQAEFAALLQAKLGPWGKGTSLAIRDEATLQRNDLNLRGEDDVFYDAVNDLLVPNHGWAVKNDADLMAVHEFGRGRKLVVGTRLTLTKGFFPESSYEVGEERTDPNGVALRLGPLLAYTFHEGKRKRFDKPTIFLLAQWHLQHRWRAGVDSAGRGVHQGIPTVAIGFAFSGELLGR